MAELNAHSDRMVFILIAKLRTPRDLRLGLKTGQQNMFTISKKKIALVMNGTYQKTVPKRP